jgi:succinate dehydrogenase/fumarate reductase flavoprotein subunit
MNSEIISFNEVTDWDQQSDIVIIGFGAAGSCASIEARKAGSSVLVLERGSGIGGTTSLATGHFYLGGGTRVQKANGIDDNADERFMYLMANSHVPEEDKIRAYEDDSVAHFDC